jgi:flagellar biosynthesis/type III secretory pathway protein FliH
MIRRLQHEGVLESITPRAVTGGRALQPMTHDEPQRAAELDAQGYRQGYAEGFQAGEEDGRREAEQYQQAWEQETRQRLDEEWQSLVREKENLAALAASLGEQLHTQRAEMEHLAFELALTSLSQAFSSGQEDGELLRRLCLQMAEAYRGKAVQLEVSAADRAQFPEQLEGLDVVVDYGLSSGECRIVTERGCAESSIATRLDAIHGAMLEALGVDRR